MNRIYRLIWSHLLKGWIAVSENARGRGKVVTRKLIAVLVFNFGTMSHASPVGGTVISGQGNVVQVGSTTNVHQGSQVLDLQWKSFNIASNEIVNFLQPSSSSVAINRISGTNGSQIMGRLNANGQVFIINPNGILFGKGAQVNVGALVASALDMNEANPGSQNKVFSGKGTGRVENLGTIEIAPGGFVALIANSVSNGGTITSNSGAVALAGGSEVTLNFNGNSIISLKVEKSVLDSLADNGGLIYAPGGKVIMSAGAKDSLLSSVVNNSGFIGAQTVENIEGKITLLGGMLAGTVSLSGQLDASAPHGGNGGFIETSAANIQITAQSQVNTQSINGRTGTWLIDPMEFTIFAGNGLQTGAGIGANTLSENLKKTNITIATDPVTSSSGNIIVNAPVTWSSNKLTLEAAQSIFVNAELNGSGSASLAFIYGQASLSLENPSTYQIKAPVNLPAGPNFSTKIGSDGTLKNFTVITNLGNSSSVTGSDLQGMQGTVNGLYALGSNIDASSTNLWNAGAGFTPVGTVANPFTGSFDGLGHSISNLSISRPLESSVGLFGAADNAVKIRNIGLVAGNIIGGAGTGGLLGTAISASVDNSYSTGTVQGGAGTGGLVGVVTTGFVNESYNTGVVAGAAGTGGLIGVLTTGSITNSYNIASVTGNAGTGGLVGVITTGNISQSFNTGNVIGNAGTGGLAGGLTTGGVSRSYVTGNVTGDAGTGGLAGNITSGDISNSFTMGNVVGAAGTGGLAGGLTSGNITGSFTTGTVVGAANTSALSGSSPAGSVSNSFALNGGHVSDNGYVLSNGETVSFASWTGSGLWSISANGTPVLKSMVKTFTITAQDATKGYDGQTYSGSYSSNISAPYDGYLSGSISYSGASQTAKNAGSFSITPGGLNTSNSQYQINYVSGALTITKANLNVAMVAANKIYDGTTFASVTGSSTDIINGDKVTFANTSATFGNKNVGTGKTVTVGGISLTGTDAGNYSLQSNTVTASADIAQKDVTLASITAAGKTYDGSDAATITAGAITTGVGTETLAISGAGTFSDKNAAIGKTVTVADVTALTKADGTGAWSNYNLTSTGAKTTTADIAKKDVTLASITAAGKTYDGNNTASITAGSINTGVGTETLAISGAGTFSDKNAATGKTVTVADVTALTKADGTGAWSNYNLTTTGAKTTTADIAQAALSITATQVTKTYDGGLSASGTATVGTLASVGDSVSHAGSQAFVDKNVGTGKTVTASGVTIKDAANADMTDNYNITYVNNTTSTITAKSLTLSMSAANKIYDGNSAATVVGSSSDIFNGDVVGFTNAGATFSDKNAGLSKTVSVTGISLSGTDAGNYSVATSAQTTADITRRNSVAWTGGATGNWFDSQNWTDGALPDLANVANISIPSGVTVSFNKADAVSIAQAGTVRIDSISSAGKLAMVSGELNISNSMTLATLQQTGGTIGGTGSVSAQSLDQSAGRIENTGNLTVSREFNQTDSGVIAIGGTIDITQTIGDLSLANLSAHDIKLDAKQGAISLGQINTVGALVIKARYTISQTPSSVLHVGNNSSLTSDVGDIELNNPLNDQNGVVSLSARNITLSDSTNPIVVINASGNSNITSVGNLSVSGSTNNLTTTTASGKTIFGLTNVNGDLLTRSFDEVLKTSEINVRGNVSIKVNGQDVSQSMFQKSDMPTTPNPTSSSNVQKIINDKDGLILVLSNLHSRYSNSRNFYKWWIKKHLNPPIIK